MQDDNSPVSVVQNGLDGIATTSRDVPLKPREQGQKHIDSEALALSEEELGERCDLYPEHNPSGWAQRMPIFPPSGQSNILVGLEDSVHNFIAHLVQNCSPI